LTFRTWPRQTRLEAEPINLGAGIFWAFSPKEVKGDGVEVAINPTSVGLEVSRDRSGVDRAREPEALQHSGVAQPEEVLKVEGDCSGMADGRGHVE
jgi:hypothetical protein